MFPACLEGTLVSTTRLWAKQRQGHQVPSTPPLRRLPPTLQQQQPCTSMLLQSRLLGLWQALTARQVTEEVLRWLTAQAGPFKGAAEAVIVEEEEVLREAHLCSKYATKTESVDIL